MIDCVLLCLLYLLYLPYSPRTILVIIFTPRMASQRLWDSPKPAQDNVRNLGVPEKYSKAIKNCCTPCHVPDMRHPLPVAFHKHLDLSLWGFWINWVACFLRPTRNVAIRSPIAVFSQRKWVAPFLRPTRNILLLERIEPFLPHLYRACRAYKCCCHN